MLLGFVRTSRVWSRRNFSSSATATSDRFCMDTVKKYDYEGYLASLLIKPESSRNAVMSFRAFNVETARVRDQVSELQAGKLRLQWWRDAVDSAAHNRPLEQPIVQSLARAMSEHKITKQWLHRVIDAREANLNYVQPRTVAELEEYAEDSASSLLYASLEACGLRDVKADHAASHLGKAIGICALLRGTHIHSKYRRVYLPVAVCAQHKLPTEDILKGAAGPELRDVVFEVANVAKGHLDGMKEIAKDVPKEAIQVLRVSNSVEIYLDRLQDHDFNVFDPATFQYSVLPYQWQLLKGSFRGSL